MKVVKGRRGRLAWLVVKIAGFLFALVLLAFLFGFLILFPWTPDRLLYYESPEPADLIVVLEGEFNWRIGYALKLVEQGFSQQILVPGYDPSERKEKLLKEIRNEFSDRVEIHMASVTSSTLEEAFRVRDFVREHDVGAILLVTSNFHSYRSWWIFRKILRGVKVISTPIPQEDSWFSPDKVEAGSFAHKIYKLEQLKFALYYLMYGWRL